MDHSYRNNQQGGSNGPGGGNSRFRPGPMTSGTTGFFQHAEVEPLPAREECTLALAGSEPLGTYKGRDVL